MARRSETIDPLVVGIYHIWNRCVRHAWLWGRDPVTGKNFNHRRKWFEDRLKLQVRLFGIEVLFHAELINHFHDILRNRPDVVATWSDEEVVRRILMINKLPYCFDGIVPEPTQAAINIELANPEKVAEYRIRLSDPSWFMKHPQQDAWRVSPRAPHHANATHQAETITLLVLNLPLAPPRRFQ